MADETSQALFEPFALGDLTLKNRGVLAPLTRARAGSQRLANDLMAEYYAQRSGAGLLITEATTVSTQANGWVNSPGIYTDAQGEAWRKVVEAVHEKESRIFLQLWHCGRASHSSFHGGELPVAPSAVRLDNDDAHTPNGKEPYETPRALDRDEIPQIVNHYVVAARRAKDAGFDGVEVHSANGYLLDQFLQTRTNHREDEYGGTIENRSRLLRQIVEAISEVFPAHRIGVRLSPNGVFNDMGSPEYREDFLYVAKMLNAYGLAYLHIVDGLAFGFHGLGEPVTLAEARNVFHGPLMGNGGYELENATSALRQGDADLIAFGRPFISNPDLLERFRHSWPLAEGDPSKWYSGDHGADGYTDYPFYRQETTGSAT